LDDVPFRIADEKSRSTNLDNIARGLKDLWCKRISQNVDSSRC